MPHTCYFTLGEAWREILTTQTDRPDLPGSMGLSILETYSKGKGEHWILEHSRDVLYEEARAMENIWNRS